MPSPFTPLARVYLLHGPEDRRKREALEALIQAAVPAEEREFALEYFDADAATTTADTILAAAAAPAFLAERRVVIVTDAGRLRDRRHQRTQERLAAAMPALGPSACLVFIAWGEEEDGGARRSAVGEKLERAIKKAGKVLDFPLLKPDQATAAAASEAAKLGKKLLPVAAGALVRAVGSDMDRLYHEVEKLALYAGERPTITEEDVAALVALAPDDNVFHMLDAVGERKRTRALQLLHGLLDSGEPPARLMTLIARQLRLVWQAKFLMERRIPLRTAPSALPEETARMLPKDNVLTIVARQPFQERRYLAQARLFTWEQIHRGFDRLVRTEAGMKGLDLAPDDPRLGLELLVVELCS
jgi:DNA polymerase III subunit delta